MKLSKSLLQAIAIGLSMGAVATSCDFLEDMKDVKPKNVIQNCFDETTTKGGHDDINCPACGMG